MWNSKKHTYEEIRVVVVYILLEREPTLNSACQPVG